MSPVQRVLNIYKAHAEFNNQGNAYSTLNSGASKKQNSSSDQSAYKNSFDKILSEKIKKYDSRHT